MELLTLQSSLQSEIQAKQAIGEELSRVRAEYMASQKELRESRLKCDALVKENLRKDTKLRELQRRLESSDGFIDRRPSSQMSFLDQFLKDSTFRMRSNSNSSDGDEDVDVDEGADEADVEDNCRAPSLASSGGAKSNVSDRSERFASNEVSPQMSPMADSRLMLPYISSPVAKAHQFLVRTFPAPTKCNHCTSLMVGLVRQGNVCEVCGFACHTSCRERVPAVCPVPPDQTKRPLGIDPTRGIGTAYEGYLRVPKPGGVKKGWSRQFVVVCDFKIFLYDLSPDRTAQPTIGIACILDMRDEEFAVSSVLESDVIHASKKDIPCIFRVTTSLLNPPGLKNQTLMLADSESEKTKWVVALNELHRIFKKNRLPNRMVYRAKEIIDNAALPIVKNVFSAAVIDEFRVVLGAEDGLFCVELDTLEIARVGDAKKIFQVEYIPEEQLLIAISGKQRHVRLIPVGALDGQEVEWVKVVDTKGCTVFCCGHVDPRGGSAGVGGQQNPAHRQQVQQIGGGYHFCVAAKRHVIVYEINRTKVRHARLREVTVPSAPQCLQMISDGRICVGYQSGFTIYNITGDVQPQVLVHLDSGPLSFLALNPVDSLGACELSKNEYLLVFATLGVFVDAQGRKSRDNEVMFLAPPLHIAFSDGYLVASSETHVDIFECISGDWVQTINVKRSKPLNTNGSLHVTFVGDLPHIVYLKNIHLDKELISVSDVHSAKRGGRPTVTRNRRRFSMREGGDKSSRAADRRSKLISAPSNFNHISHMGPGEGIHIQRLMDLPTAISSINQDGRVPKPKPVFPPGRLVPSKMSIAPPHPPDHHPAETRTPQNGGGGHRVLQQQQPPQMKQRGQPSPNLSFSSGSKLRQPPQPPPRTPLTPTRIESPDNSSEAALLTSNLLALGIIQTGGANEISPRSSSPRNRGGQQSSGADDGDHDDVDGGANWSIETNL